MQGTMALCWIAEEFLSQVHVVKVLANLIPVGVYDTIRFHTSWSIILPLFLWPICVPLIISCFLRHGCSYNEI